MSPQEFRERYQRVGEPVLLEGAAADWVDLWTPQKLRERFGERTLNVERQDGYTDARQLIPVKLDEFVRGIEDGSSNLTLRGYKNLAHYFPELLEPFLERDCFADWIGAASTVPELTLWIQPKGNFTYLHLDGYLDNLHALVYGRKRFLLAPPADFADFYPYGWMVSMVDPFAPDLERFPRAANITFYEVTLEAGDLLYIPGHWWHAVRSDSVCVSANRWFEPSLGVLAQLRRCPVRDKAALLVMHYLFQKTSFARKALKRVYEMFRPREQFQPPTTSPGSPAES